VSYVSLVSSYREVATLCPRRCDKNTETHKNIRGISGGKHLYDCLWRLDLRI